MGYGPFRGSQWGSIYRKIMVPSNVEKLQVDTWGGTGDANVYVRYNAVPWLESNYRARGIIAGNAHSLTIWGPARGYWYVRVYANRDYAGLFLRARYTENGIPTIASGSTYTRSGTRYSKRHMRIWVPAGKAKLVVKTWGGRGNSDLYVKRYSQPGLHDYGVRSYGPGNAHTATINNPMAGYWYIMIYGDEYYDGVCVKAAYSDAPPTATQINTNVTYGPRTAAVNNQVYYRIWVPAGRSKLSVKTWGGTGDADVYLKWNALPTTTSYAVRGYGVTNSENVAVNNPNSGWWYVMICGYRAYSGLYWRVWYNGPSGVFV